jgi:2-(3-amino-3-carboxypropyl)histidine synthase
MYDFKLDQVCDFIRVRGARTVALQMPEGLKTHAQRISDELSDRTGVGTIILGDPCYGACDISHHFSRYADVLVHFGHAEIPSLNDSDRVLFVEVILEFDVVPLLEKALPLLKDRIGLVTTVQHVPLLEKAKAFLHSRGKVCLIGKGDGRIKHEGQVLGCNVTSALSIRSDVDQFLFIGSGDFHPLAVSLETKRPVIVVDPILDQVRTLDELTDRVLRQRYAAIARALDAERFGILVSSKSGQDRFALALDLAHRLRGKGKRADIILMDVIGPDQLLAFQVDAFVSTACPRLAIDDQVRYPKPLLTPIELEVLLGDRAWEDYRMDSILG